MPPWLGPHTLSYLPTILLSPIRSTNDLSTIAIASYEGISAVLDFYFSILSFLPHLNKKLQNVIEKDQLYYPPTPTQPSISKATVPFLNLASMTGIINQLDEGVQDLAAHVVGGTKKLQYKKWGASFGSFLILPLDPSQLFQKRKRYNNNFGLELAGHPIQYFVVGI